VYPFEVYARLVRVSNLVMLPLASNIIMQLSSNPTSPSPTTAQTKVINVEGMHCANCVQTVETQLLRQPGILSAKVDLATATVTIECEADANLVELVDRLTAAGFPSQLLHSKVELVDNAQASIRWTLLGFFILVVIFNLCLNAQVLTVGLAYFYNPDWWKGHVWLVRSYSGLSLILSVWAYSITVPHRVRSLTVSMPVLLGLQFLTIHLKTPIPLAIVHPLIGFTLFSVSTTLVHRVSRFLFPRADESL
jgi:copper chaperone CopZ